MKTKLLYLVIICITSFSANSQNLLNTNSWTVGSGSVFGYSQNGATSENSREYGSGPKGTSELLWKATPDASSNADGGWNSSYSNIDHTKTYRFVIWLKKTNSNNGSSYFGFNSNYNNGLTLNGTVNNNPYFWSGDLPQLNKWYMLVGYVHGSTYSSTISYGGIYDGTTGEKVKVSFSNEINRYNYLDKSHNLKFVYDFENFFTKKEVKFLQNKVHKLNKTENIAFIIISDKKPLKESFIESTKITNEIFRKKFSLSKVVTLKMSKISRDIAIAYTNSLSNKINDSLCDIVIKKILKPSFIDKEYYNGVNESIDSILNYIK